MLRIMTIFNSVYKSFTPVQPRTPGANTIAYYTFDSQTLADSSGNNNDGTWYNGNGTYVAVGDGYCANLGGSHAIQLPFNLGGLTDFTFNTYVNFQSFSKGSGLQAILGNAEWATGAMHICIDNTKLLEIAEDGFTALGYQTSMATDTWYNVCITKTGTTYSIYINGSLGTSGTLGSVGNYTEYIGKAYTNDRYPDGYFDSVIFENKCWTTQEVSDYFNSTKSDYGIS